MRRKTPVASTLYSYMFPQQQDNSSGNFATFLSTCLIPEVRVETACFYGSLDTIEARYPGLNYCHPPHRMRLGRFPHHARLFKAIDELGITDQEVADLARWEGTLWARRRFERDEGVKIEDTTGTSIMPWVDVRAGKGIRIKVERDVKVTQEESPLSAESQDPIDMPHNEEFIEGYDCMDEDDDAQIGINQDVTASDQPRSHGIQTASRSLEQRILAAFAARQQGSTIDIHPDLEAYLKELVENGHLLAASRPADGPLPDSDTSPALPNLNPTLGQSAA